MVSEKSDDGLVDVLGMQDGREYVIDARSEAWNEICSNNCIVPLLILCLLIVQNSVADKEISSTTMLRFRLEIRKSTSGWGETREQG